MNTTTQTDTQEQIELERAFRVYLARNQKPSASCPVPAAACPRCGGWTNYGGMSQHANAVDPVLGRTGCTCAR